MLRSFLRLFASDRPARPLFAATVAAAREPHWYVAGGVPDTLDGRFAVLASLTALVNLRLESGGEEAQRLAVALAECFIDEMDGEVRQMGLGDPAIGKQVGRLVGALGRRVARFRQVAAGDGGWGEAVADSLHPGRRPSAAVLAHGEAAIRSWWAALQRADDSAVMAGEWR